MSAAHNTAAVWLCGMACYFFWTLWRYADSDGAWVVVFATLIWPIDLLRELYRAGRQWWRT